MKGNSRMMNRTSFQTAIRGESIVSFIHACLSSYTPFKLRSRKTFRKSQHIIYHKRQKYTHHKWHLRNNRQGYPDEALAGHQLPAEEERQGITCWYRIYHIPAELLSAFRRSPISMLRTSTVSITRIATALITFLFKPVTTQVC